MVGACSGRDVCHENRGNTKHVLIFHRWNVGRFGNIQHSTKQFTYPTPTPKYIHQSNTSTNINSITLSLGHTSPYQQEWNFLLNIFISTKSTVVPYQLAMPPHTHTPPFTVAELWWGQGAGHIGAPIDYRILSLAPASDKYYLWGICYLSTRAIESVAAILIHPETDQMLLQRDLLAFQPTASPARNLTEHGVFQRTQGSESLGRR